MFPPEFYLVDYSTKSGYGSVGICVAVEMESTPSTADRLVFAAMKLFLEKGYGSTSVQDILREAKANAGSLYHAFPTKQDVLLAVLGNIIGTYLGLVCSHWCHWVSGW